MVLDMPALGTFRLPDELICHVAELGDLYSGLILSATNEQLFTILYDTIVEKIRHIDATTCWNYDRLICVGKGKTTLPVNYLSEDERNEVVAWYWWYDYEWEESPEIPASGSTIETTLKEIGPEDYSALYEEISVALFEYGRAMPPLREVQHQQQRDCTFPEGIIDHPQISKTDSQRLSELQLSVVSRKGLIPKTLESEKVLVNVTKREFVKAVDSQRHFTLEKAVPHLTRWGLGEVIGTVERGDWAGDRLSVILCSELEEKMEEEEGWRERVIQWSSDE